MSERRSSRRLYIEILRIIACFLVIVNHTNSRIFLEDPTTATGMISLAYFFMSKAAVPVFLFIMGAVMLGRVDTPKKGITRIVRIIGVLVLFSFMYHIWQYVLGRRSLYPSEFFKLLISGKHTVAFWYLYAYLGLLCVLPLMQKMSLCLSRNDILLMMTLSLGVIGVLPVLSTFREIDISSDIGKSFFPVNIAMVFTGYYLEKYSTIDKKRFLCACAGFIGTVALQVAATLRLYSWNSENYLYLDHYTYATITLEAVCLFYMVRYLVARRSLSHFTGEVLRFLGSLTFGIYLLQDMVIELTMPLYYKGIEYVHPIPVVIVWEVLVFCVCSLITFILKKLPVFRRLL